MTNKQAKEEKQRIREAVEEIRAELHNGKDPYSLVVELLFSIDNQKKYE